MALEVRAAAPSNSSAKPQGGVFDGLDPTVYNAADPVVLFIIQVTIVMALTRLLHWPLSKIREPQVIAEVIAVSTRTEFHFISILSSTKHQTFC
jgi:hypothetical protein